MRIKYSWILPIRNEVLSLSQLLSEIVQAMSHIGNFSAKGGPAPGWEIIAVDDLSNDGTWQVLKDLKKKYDQLKTVHFESRQGKWSALGYPVLILRS